MISENIRRIQERINSACRRKGRDPKEVTLVCVTKEASLNDIIDAIGFGMREVGENRVQDALVKYKALQGKGLKWHMIGHLQTNKVKDALKIFDLIHSVDSVKLAKAIQSEAIKQNKLVDALLEVNTSGESNKFGIEPEKFFGVLEDILKLSNVRVLGLMTMAPLVSNQEGARPFFKKLKNMLNEANNKFDGLKLKCLSMGMTQDFEVAVEEGANIVRVGRAIFEGEV
ncbi:MAG: YggS family pyridoxal phosphate-dependent enzyme [Candidatus Omnitrophica bacterium CG07_land_8_20_14_0_80_42_15]|uniref:Pyridoxal phosphate homeostasis protein n=1 Tax=Candidatus Aquitaenariimonas noxiae TaxID=1974741 RepID=A0A2J0KV06_9BACT|nr:MAG: YggS family pyridoxal phosphate-dependent enzyme [Candidatus Omnitrophica bacterium CG07_land_8_20_14_0_80_42_15]